jgi:hypothetical protein
MVATARAWPAMCFGVVHMAADVTGTTGIAFVHKGLLLCAACMQEHKVVLSSTPVWHGGLDACMHVCRGVHGYSESVSLYSLWWLICSFHGENEALVNCCVCC